MVSMYGKSEYDEDDVVEDWWQHLEDKVFDIDERQFTARPSKHHQHVHDHGLDVTCSVRLKVSWSGDPRENSREGVEGAAIRKLIAYIRAAADHGIEVEQA